MAECGVEDELDTLKGDALADGARSTTVSSCIPCRIPRSERTNSGFLVSSSLVRRRALCCERGIPKQQSSEHVACIACCCSQTALDHRSLAALAARSATRSSVTTLGRANSRVRCKLHRETQTQTTRQHHQCIGHSCSIVSICLETSPDTDKPGFFVPICRCLRTLCRSLCHFFFYFCYQ